MDDKLRKLIDGVSAKRPRTVLDHILKHGQITTEELKEVYGYSHPPRAARDVREQGIPLKTTSVTGKDGRQMAAYALDEDAAIEGAKMGRTALPKELRSRLAELHGEQCTLCGGHFPARALQVDHRVPYEVAGESAGTHDADAFMLVDGSCNRAKSWSCEHCANYTAKVMAVCKTCMWASPEDYTHVAMEQRRRLDLVWEGAEVADYDRFAATAGDDVRDLIKNIVRRHGRPPKS